MKTFNRFNGKYGISSTTGNERNLRELGYAAGFCTSVLTPVAGDSSSIGLGTLSITMVGNSGCPPILSMNTESENYSSSSITLNKKYLKTNNE